jgi:CRP/FNR family cyclic AMP-dependent transcriptional regulator
MSPVTAMDASFYGMLARTDRDELRAGARARVYHRGYLLTVEGEPAGHVTVLLDGWAKAAFVTTGGVEAVLRLYGPGDLFGGEAILGDQARSESVTALTSCRCLATPAARFTELLARSPGTARAFRNVMVQRLLAADHLVKARLDPPHARLARALTDLAYRFGAGAPDGTPIPVYLSQEELASWIGTSRVTVARMLNQLRRDGVIHTGYRNIVITDLEQLNEIARTG